MKKVFAVLSLVMFIGTMSVSAYAMNNSDKVEVVKNGDDKKKKKNAKSCASDAKAGCSTEEKKACGSTAGEAPKCCASKAAGQK
jgi:hypothetical protein